MVFFLIFKRVIALDLLACFFFLALLGVLFLFFSLTFMGGEVEYGGVGETDLRLRVGVKEG